MGLKTSIVLVSCGKHKLSVAAPAKDLYISPRFREARKFAEKFADRWFVLSAKHGLTSPDSLILPYDLDLGGLDEEQKQAWACNIVDELLRKDLLECEITVLAAGDYAEILSNHLQCCCSSLSFPLRDADEGAEFEVLSRLNQKPKRFYDYKKFYKLLSRLNSMAEQQARFGEISGKGFEKAGVYFFFDPNENTRFIVPQVQRVVRVGTHAVSKGSKSQLWQRLRTHRGNEDGSGSHRSSVFRLHIGSAMLALNGEKSASWAVGDNATSLIRESERTLESEVSRYMRALTLSYLPILDPSSPDSDRSYIEMNSIALLSGGGPIDQQSKKWLGNFSPTPEIRASGLWNINYVGADYDPVFLDVFDELISRYENGNLSTQSLAPENWRIQVQRGNVGQQQLF